MKGLLLKDWYVLLRQARWTLIVAMVYVLLPLANGHASFISAFAIVFCAMLPLNLMALDEKAGFDRYALSLPCSRRDVVYSRYLLGLLAVSAVSVLYLLVSLMASVLHDGATPLAILCSAAPMLAVGLLYLSVSLPIAFRIGVEKARMWFVLATAVIAGSVAAASSILAEEQEVLLELLSGTGILWVIPAALVLFGLSLLLSLRLYETREM